MAEARRVHPIVLILLLAILAIILYPTIQHYIGIGVRRPPAVPPVEPYVGPIKFTVFALNSFVPTQSLSITPTFYRKTPAGWFALGSGNITITLQVADKGKLYLALSSLSNYIDDQMIKSANPDYVTDIVYQDVNNDGYPDHVVELTFTTANVKAPAGTTPEISLLTYGIPVDTAVDFNSPADITGVGTAPRDVYVNWKLAFSGVNKGIKALELHVYTNVTDETEIQLVQLASVFGIFDRANIVFEGANKRWVIRLPIAAKDEPHALLLKYAEGMNPDFAYFTAKFRTTFSASSAIQAKIFMRIIKPDNTFMDIDDLVLIAK